MKRYFKALIYLTLLLYSNNVFAAKCSVSKKYIDNYEPAFFNTTNNLLSNYKNLPESCSNQIILKGRVLDEKCKPIPYAKVHIWQVGCDGKYPYLPLRNKIDTRLINLNQTDSFLGSGTAKTNTLGEFDFITIYPKSKIKYINLRVQGNNIDTLQTKFFVKEPASVNLCSKSRQGEFNFDIIVRKNFKKIDNKSTNY